MTTEYRHFKALGSREVHAISTDSWVSPCLEMNINKGSRTEAKLTCDTCIVEVGTAGWLQAAETVDSV